MGWRFTFANITFTELVMSGAACVIRYNVVKRKRVSSKVYNTRKHCLTCLKLIQRDGAADIIILFVHFLSVYRIQFCDV